MCWIDIAAFVICLSDLIVSGHGGGGMCVCVLVGGGTINATTE